MIAKMLRTLRLALPIAFLACLALAPSTALAQSELAPNVKKKNPLAPLTLPIPTLVVTYTPSQATAGQTFRTKWTTGAGVDVSYSCLASGTGFTESGYAGNGTGYVDKMAQPAWVGFPSSCTWIADNGEVTVEVYTTLVTQAGTTPPPTISVVRLPAQMTAGSGFRLSWGTTNTTSLNRVCTASGTGFKVNDYPAPTGNNSATGTALAAWVGYPSTCTWTATGPGGSASFVETMTTVAAAPAAPSISVTRTPSPMTAGLSFTVGWTTSNATSLSRVCTAVGSGYSVSDTQNAGGGSLSGTAQAAWAGYPSTCTWTAQGPGGSSQFVETMTTNLPPPTISVSRSPNPMVAGGGYVLTWSTTNTTSLSRSCSASGTGYTVNDAPAAGGSSSSGTAQAAWVGYPSTCTWTAQGQGGTKQYVETMTTVAAATPAPTISVTRNPSQMVIGASFTLSWSTTNTTSLTRACTASGTGFVVNDAPAAGGGSSSGTALAAWAGYPSTCTWTAQGPGGSRQFVETMMTIPPPTISVTRTPATMTAGAGFTLGWSTTNATSISRVCTSSGTGFTVNDAPVVGANPTAGTALAAWVGYPSTCTWIATGPGGSKQFVETMTTNATTSAPTLTVTRSPATMTAGAGFTLAWSTTNTTALSRVCTASGTGFTVSDAPAAAGSSSSGTALAVWVGYPSTCTWNATGPSGSTQVIETMTTIAAQGGATYIHTDGLGSPVARTNASGAVISTTRYEPYGMVAAGATPTIGFTGHVQDADTGLIYMQQRYYDPLAGRFLSIDPVTTDANTGGSFNRYNYANNNPYKFIDPDGRLPILVPLAYAAYRAYSAYDTVETVIASASVLSDPAASQSAKVMAGAELAGSVLGGKGGKAGVQAVNRSVKNAVSDATVVCRGGSCTKEAFTAGKGVTTDAAGKLNGVSTGIGKTVAEASSNIPHPKVGVTTAGDIRAAGGQVINDHGNHATVSGITAEKAAELFKDVVKNPNN